MAKRHTVLPWGGNDKPSVDCQDASHPQRVSAAGLGKERERGQASGEGCSWCCQSAGGGQSSSQSDQG